MPAVCARPGWLATLITYGVTANGRRRPARCAWGTAPGWGRELSLLSLFVEAMGLEPTNLLTARLFRDHLSQIVRRRPMAFTWSNSPPDPLPAPSDPVFRRTARDQSVPAGCTPPGGCTPRARIGHGLYGGRRDRTELGGDL